MHEIAIVQSLKRGQALAAAINARKPENLAWVGVYPLDLSSHLTVDFLRNHGLAAPFAGTTAYRIRTFEVPKSLIEADIWIAEPDMENKHSYFAFGEQQLRETLRALDIPFGCLDLPYRSDYPI